MPARVGGLVGTLWALGDAARAGPQLVVKNNENTRHLRSGACYDHPGNENPGIVHRHPL